MRAKAIGAATLALPFLLLSIGAVRSQAPQPGEARSPLSAIAHDLTNWLGHVTGNSPDRRRAAASPSPLPRPRPAEPAPSPVVSNVGPSSEPAIVVPKKKAVPPILIND